MELQTFFSVFLLIFIAELGDKTQLITLSITGSSGSPWPVFFGSSLALTTSTALAVFAGGTTGSVLPKIAPYITAGLFFIFGIVLLFQKSPTPVKQALLNAYLLESEEANIIKRLTKKHHIDPVIFQKLYTEELHHAREFKLLIKKSYLCQDDLNNDPMIQSYSDNMSLPKRLIKKPLPEIVARLIQAEKACIDLYKHLFKHLQEEHHKDETYFRDFLSQTIEEEKNHITLFKTITKPTTSTSTQKDIHQNRPKLFLTAFVLVFFAELGDKTQLTAFSASAATPAPLAVFLGGSAALIFSSFISISIGKWLSNKIKEQTIKRFSAILFLAAGMYLLVQKIL